MTKRNAERFSTNGAAAKETNDSATRATTFRNRNLSPNKNLYAGAALFLQWNWSSMASAVALFCRFAPFRDRFRSSDGNGVKTIAAIVKQCVMR